MNELEINNENRITLHTFKIPINKKISAVN